MSTSLLSPFANLFLAIQARLTEMVPALRYVDQDFGQLEFYGDRPAVSWPCALIDIDSFQFDNQGDGVQDGPGVVNIRLGFPSFSQSSNLAPVEWRSRALAFYDLEYAVQKALHAWRPVLTDDKGEEVYLGFTHLDRAATATEKRSDVNAINVRVRAIAFNVHLTDDSVMPDRQTLADFFGSDYSEDYNEDYGPAQRPGLVFTTR